MNSLISVIVPVYRVEKYLDKCVESIVNQTYKNLEIILVDDGSDDNSPDICDEWASKDSRIKVIHKQNGGLSDARNAGLDIATGDYIAFVDSDDFLSPHMYRFLLEKLESEDADISVCGVCKMKQNGYKIIKEQEQNKQFVLGFEEAFEYIYFGKNGWHLIIAPNKLFKADIWKDLRFDKGKIHEDEFIFHRLVRRCKKIVYNTKPLYMYRQNDNSIMATRNSKSYIDAADALIQRGMEFAVVSRKWHKRNLQNIIGLYHSSTKFSADKKEAERIKKASLQYAKTLRNKKIISFVIFLKKRLEITAPRLNRLLGICLRAVLKPTKKAVNFITADRKAIKNMVDSCDCLLINTITHGNLGDQAIVLAEHSFFNSVNENIKILEFTGDETENNLRIIKNAVSRDKTIFIHGGGYIGSIWAHEELRLRRFIKAFSKHRVVLLPQTVTFDMESKEGRAFFEESKKVYSRHKNLTLFVREQKSFDFMKENMPDVDCRVVPDIVLSYKPKIKSDGRNGILLCLRSDIEKITTDAQLEEIISLLKLNFEDQEIIFTDTVVDHEVKSNARQTAVFNKLEQFSSAKLIITDRLHGMIFALLSKTPCIALGNINGKVKAVYEWFKDCPFVKYIDDLSELTDCFLQLKEFIGKNNDYDFDIKKFLPLFDLIEKEGK